MSPDLWSATQSECVDKKNIAAAASTTGENFFSNSAEIESWNTSDNSIDHLLKPADLSQTLSVWLNSRG